MAARNSHLRPQLSRLENSDSRALYTMLEDGVLTEREVTKAKEILRVRGDSHYLWGLREASD